jgi:serine phosphatase RsbU (regulator of sigma subunit)
VHLDWVVRGDVAEGLGNGLQSRVQRFKSARRLPRSQPLPQRASTLAAMAPPLTARLNLRDLLAAVEDAPPVAAADAVAAGLAAAVNASGVAFLIADFSGQALIRLGHVGADSVRRQGQETAEPVRLVGTPHGRTLETQAVVMEECAGGTCLYAPVTNRGEAIGVLELTLPAPPSEQTRADVALAAHVLAYVVIANRRFTDLFEWGQRLLPLSLAAEIQHRLLPGAYTCEAGQFTLAAWLEPAGDVGGDTFDFSIDRETLHLSLTDAMGHTVDSAVLATVLVGALRNARRAGVGLAEQAFRANRDLEKYAQSGEFVTGQVARIDLRAETATIVNAGHPPPLRLRDGRVQPVPLEAAPPFGVLPGCDYRIQPLPLAAGDRLIFFTDGMLERNTLDIDIGILIEEGAEMHPREAVQQLIRALLEVTGGDLKDDATVLCLDWHGGPPRQRTSDGGANSP